MFRYRIAIIVCRGLLFEMKMKQVFPSYGTNTSFIALFPGHSCIQFLIACSMQTVSDQTLDGVKRSENKATVTTFTVSMLCSGVGEPGANMV